MKTTGLAWTTYQAEWNRNFFAVATEPKHLSCSYCRSQLELGRDNCRTCGAPA